MLHYHKVDSCFLNIDSKAISEKQARPIHQYRHICNIVYKLRLRRLTVNNSIRKQCSAVPCYVAYYAPTGTVDAPLALNVGRQLRYCQ